jgi:hypothetical protein
MRSPEDVADGLQDVGVESAADLAEQREGGIRIAEELIRSPTV